MRKKIKQLAYGTFDYKEPGFSLSPERIELEVTEGKQVTGEFSINCVNGKKLRGIVYTTHPRMECLTPQFEGEEIRVRYQFHTEGLIDGDVRKGEFVIVCDQGEYNLSFVVSISKSFAKTSIGTIKNLSDFTVLARESFAEAYQVFYSICFSNILTAEEEKERMLYEMIRREPPSMQAVEAYLVGIGKKPRIQVELDKTVNFFDKTTDSRKEEICLKKDNWGYVSAQVKTDAAFISLEKDSITTEDFLGSTCFFPYYIDTKKLHGGKNYGRILFEFPDCTLTSEVCVIGTEEEHKGASANSKVLQYKTGLTRLYVDYRTKKIVTGVWAKQSIQLLESLLEIEPECELYRLMKAQAFLMNRQKQEASWILEEYKRTCIDRMTPEWGYYLYLCTLMEREESYVNRLADQIEELFRMYPENSLLFWVLLFVREDYYKNNARRLKAVERWIEKGCDSPYFYLEAYYLFWHDPYLLTKLDRFTIKILNWARKQHALSKEIAMQVLQLVPAIRVYDEKIFKLLIACYELLDMEEAVAAICSYLIKGQKFSKEYHKWYALGIEYEVRITNLYEAYLLSADKESLQQVPKVIFMYFQYNNNLSYRQLALLYAFIIEHKDSLGKVYQNYRRTMEQFAMAQIEAGHMDENLAVVYKDMLQRGILNAELAEKLANILFVHKLTIKKEKSFAKAMVLQKQYKRPEIVPVIDGFAYFQAYTKDYCVLLIDGKGQIFAEQEWFEEEALLVADTYLDAVMELAPYAVPYLVATFEQKFQSNLFLVEDIASFTKLMQADVVNDAWKAMLQPAFAHHMVSKEAGEAFLECLKTANYELMQAKDRCFMIEQLIENHLFEVAYEMLHLYGFDAMGSAYRVSLCSYEINNQGQEEDEFLLRLSDATFASGKYNDVILEYLCRYYHGPTKYMASIWRAAQAFCVKTYDIEERIISQMLYSTDYVEDIEAIYQAYSEKGAKDMISRAYLTYFSHLYLVKDSVVPVSVFTEIEHRILLCQEINDVYQYALLKYYAEQEKLTESQWKIADKLLLECTCQDVYFAFYKKLDERLVTKYCLQDKSFVEYHSKPGVRAHINYYINDNSLVQEEMTEVYDGIFVKTFVLFFEDKISYYVTETDGKHGHSITSSGQLENHDVYVGSVHSRYAILNDIYVNFTLQEQDTMLDYMKEYQEKSIVVERIFKRL